MTNDTRNRDAMQTETIVLPSEDARAARVRIDMAAGEIDLRGGAGAGELLHGRFRHPSEWGVHATVQREDAGVSVRVEQDRLRFRLSRNWMHEWDIQLNDRLPTDLQVKLAAGDLDADLSTLALTRLVVEQSTGNAELRLAGDHRALREIDVEGSVGKTELELRGQFEALRTLKLEGATGDLTLDLRGTWLGPLDARVRVATGKLTLKLPRDAGVEVEAKTSLGSIEADHLVRDGRCYRNRAWGQAPVALRIAATVNLGTIEIEAED